MIVTEIITINGTEFNRTYSSSGFFIEREGVKYAEAVDPIGFGREYVETEELIPSPEATEEEYLAALARLGVE